MKRVFVAAIVCGVWLSGVSSAAALTYVLDRPLTPSSAFYQSRHAAELTERSSVSDPELSVAVKKDGPAAAPTSVAHATRSESPRDIRDMACAPLRDLDMGSGRVTICE